MLALRSTEGANGNPGKTALIAAFGVKSGRNPPDTCPDLADEACIIQALYQNRIIFLTYNQIPGNLDGFMQA